jgi:LPS-assembly protein
MVLLGWNHLPIDKPEELGTAWNVVLKLKRIPIFYFPYISFPLTHKRKTGFLSPKPGYSGSNVFTYKQPIYLNIAPNMDATITPMYLQKRGTLLSTEFRYLFDIGTGALATQYINNGKLHENLTRKGKPIDGTARYLLHSNHNVTFAKHWNISERKLRQPNGL